MIKKIAIEITFNYNIQDLDSSIKELVRSKIDPKYEIVYGDVHEDYAGIYGVTDGEQDEIAQTLLATDGVAVVSIIENLYR